MKVIIAGSRTITDYSLVEQAVIDSGFQISEVISGNARGVDRLGEKWALENAVDVKIFKADWEEHGKGAGFIRNRKMAVYAQEHSGALIAIHDGNSKGTANMIEAAKAFEMPIFLFVP